MCVTRQTQRHSGWSRLEWCIENSLLCVHKYLLIAVCQFALQLPRRIRNLPWRSLNMTALWISDEGR